jgi:hypothetical protein
MKADALALAESGWAVFPCVERGDDAKRPYTKNGFKDATTDPVWIERWWTRWPHAMIGAPVPESLVVLDVDPRNGGSLESLEECLGQLPRTLTAWSGRGDGGRHLYYHRPAGVLTSSNLPEGIDLKIGGRGYCIVPPSIHPETGMPYRWDVVDVAHLPRAAARQLRPIPRRTFRAPAVSFGDSSHLVRWLERFPDQGINNALYWAARRADENGSIDEIAERLIAKAVSLGESEIRARRTVESARSRLDRIGGQQR